MRLLAPAIRSSALVLLSSAYLAQRRPVQRIHVRATTVLAAEDGGDTAADRGGDGEMWVTALHRFAIKGLERDSFARVDLESGGAFPHDRQWALLYNDAPQQFEPSAPTWLHKANFLCAFTANQLMASFVSRFDDATGQLIVSRRADGAALLRENLEEPDGRRRVGAFFSNVSGRAVSVVSSGGGSGGAGGAGGVSQHHQFGNTGSGIRAGDGSSRTVHIINSNTVAALSAASGVPLHADRFRANVILSGALPAWREFSWVGRTIRLGAVTLRVIQRTVRCDGINVDARHGSGAADVDVVRMLETHFPQHGPYLGVYAQVVGGGTVSVGDRVTA